MRRAGALFIAVLGVLLLRAQLQPAGPQPIRAAERPPAETAADRGRLVYQRYGCALCHGADGKGGLANPNSETEGKVPGVVMVAEGYTRAELTRLVRNGVSRIGREDAAGPVPPYRMPGWGDRMTAQEVDDLVEHLIGLYPDSARKAWR